MIRPTISMSPSRRTSSVWTGSIMGGRPRSVDVVAVASRADVTLRIERLAAQRTGQPPRGDDLEGAVDEGPSDLEGQPDLEGVGPFELVVVDPLERCEELTGRRPGDPFDGR